MKFPGKLSRLNDLGTSARGLVAGAQGHIDATRAAIGNAMAENPMPLPRAAPPTYGTLVRITWGLPYSLTGEKRTVAVDVGVFPLREGYDPNHREKFVTDLKNGIRAHLDTTREFAETSTGTQDGALLQLRSVSATPNERAAILAATNTAVESLAQTYDPRGQRELREVFSYQLAPGLDNRFPEFIPGEVVDIRYYFETRRCNTIRKVQIGGLSGPNVIAGESAALNLEIDFTNPLQPLVRFMQKPQL